jgi:hypothetical protein
MIQQVFAIRRTADGGGFSHRSQSLFARWYHRRPSLTGSISPKIPVSHGTIDRAKHFASVEEARAEIAWLVEHNYRSSIWEIVSTSFEKVKEVDEFGSINYRKKIISFEILPAVEVAS